MAYDLHIVRTNDWTQAASTPITKQDVDALISEDSELAWSDTDYVDMANTRYYMITWQGQPCFWWYRDQIQCSGPDEAQVSKLVQMARVLRAQVVGDDGEVYLLEHQPASAKPADIAPEPKHWPLWKQLIVAFLLGSVLLALKLLIFGD